MTEPSCPENIIDELAEEFACRRRAGEHPSVEEYVGRHPQWGAQIRAILSAVTLMERLKPERETPLPIGFLAGTSPPLLNQLGEFRIIREIGRGGMGIVYEAQQESLGRRVAIKVLPSHLVANENVRKRFHQEAQAAARLHHTNIVPVFGVGERDGLCFYVMQLIEGRGLDRVIRDAHSRTDHDDDPTEQWHDVPALDAAPTAPDGRALDKSASSDDPLADSQSLLFPGSPQFFFGVARIGFQVAGALAYAHSQGVIHRDIKPANLLLDRQGSIWVTDFGVAKVVEGVGLTQSGDLIGTLKYIPPERFAGHSDARGDVYSLGMTLYELLTLRPAFLGTTPHQLIQQITHESPLRPRKVNPRIPADLETIVLKALARDPAERYLSAAALAEDLQRFLADRPILARRTTYWEHCRRWTRRNPALATAGAVAFLLMIAITLVSVIAYTRTAAANRVADRANIDMKAALASEQTQREEAERMATLALGSLNRTYERFAPNRLVVAPDIAAGVEIPTHPVLPPEVVPLLEDLLQTYQRIADSAGQYSKLQPQAAEANHRIGDISRRLGRFPESVAAYRRALDFYQHLPTDPVDIAHIIARARVYNELARTLRLFHQHDEARQTQEQAVQLLEGLPSDLAQRPECRYELACSYYALAQRDFFVRNSGSPKEAGHGPADQGRGPHFSKKKGWGDSEPKGSHRDRPGGPAPPDSEPGSMHAAARAVNLLNQLVQEYPNVPEYRHLLACCLRDLPMGPMHRQPSNPEDDLELFRKLVRDFPHMPDYRLDLCEALARVDRPGPGGPRASSESAAKTRGYLQESVSLSGELVAQYPAVPEYAAAHARYLDQLGMKWYDAREWKEAEKCHRAAVGQQSQLVKNYPQVIGYRLWLGLMERALGRDLGRLGDLVEARKLIQSGIERVEALWQSDSRLGGARPFLGMAYRDLAQVLRETGDSVGAEMMLKKAENVGKGNAPRSKGTDVLPFPKERPRGQ